MSPVDAHLAEASAAVRRRTGLALDAAGRDRLRDALAVEVAARGRAAGELTGALDHDDELLQAVVDGVTLQETSFFRDVKVFETLEREVLPGLHDPVVVWSAGCADGHEAYSLAMLLAESGRTGWRVLGTDVSVGALRRARAGRYPERRLRGLSPERRERHLVQRDGLWAVRDELRERVHFAHHNLAREPLPPAAEGAQLVLCRNVLIYVDRPDVTAFLDRLHDGLPAGALLLVGAAESLWHLSDRFALVPLGHGFAYRHARDARDARPRRRRGTDPRGRPARPAQERRRAPAPARRPAPPSVATPAPAAGSGADELLVIGERALTDGRAGDAVDAFRRAAYVAPDSVLAHLQLGLALEAAGDAGATRAYRAAWSALGRADEEHVERALGGYRVQELARMLAAKLGAG